VEDLDEVSQEFRLTDAQFEEIWARFIQLETSPKGLPPVNLLGSVSAYKKLFKLAAT
jgi:hypothetical protein